MFFSVCTRGAVLMAAPFYILAGELMNRGGISERIIHFAGRGQMDIDGMGEKVVHQLADAGLLNSFGDIFTLHKKRDAVLAPRG